MGCVDWLCAAVSMFGAVAAAKMRRLPLLLHNVGSHATRLCRAAEPGEAPHLVVLGLASRFAPTPRTQACVRAAVDRNPQSSSWLAYPVRAALGTWQVNLAVIRNLRIASDVQISHEFVRAIRPLRLLYHSAHRGGGRIVHTQAGITCLPVPPASSCSPTSMELEPNCSHLSSIET